MTVAEAVQRSKTFAAMRKGSIKVAQNMLLPNEDVLWAMVSNVTLNPGKNMPTPGSMSLSGKTNGVIVVTTQRLFFVSTTFGQGISKEFRLSDIRTLDMSTGLMGSACLLVVSALSKILIDGNVESLNNLSKAINTALAKEASQSTSDNALDTTDVSQLQALKQLYDSGVITAEEFAAKKAQILNL